MTAAHPDVYELAEHAEGILEPGRKAQLDVHLVGCSDCNELLAALHAVPVLLADVPSPPMPIELAARLESVLHGEAARRTAESRADTGANTDAGSRVVAPTPIAPRRSASTWTERHPRLRLAAAAAATVAVLGGGVALINPPGLSTGGSAETSSAGGTEQRDSSVEGRAGGEAAESAPAREDAYSAELEDVARRLQAREKAAGDEVRPPLTAAVASVQGLRVGMAAS